LSYENDGFALDLGTVIVPFPTLKVSMHVELITDTSGDGLFGPSDTVEYTIRVINQSVRRLPNGCFTFVLPNLDQQTYIDGSTQYKCSANATFFGIADNKNGTKFPLDASGLSSKCALHGKGDEHVIAFRAKVVETEQLTSNTLGNSGVLRNTLGQDLPYEVSVPLVLPTMVRRRF
jgi:hypothetical protein